MLTWGIVEILEPSLEWVHNGVGIQLAIQFIHGEAISVLDGAITKGEAEDPAELCCRDGDNGFRQYYRVKFAQACHGLEVQLATTLSVSGGCGTRTGAVGAAPFLAPSCWKAWWRDWAWSLTTSQRSMMLWLS